MMRVGRWHPLAEQQKVPLTPGQCLKTLGHLPSASLHLLGCEATLQMLQAHLKRGCASPNSRGKRGLGPAAGYGAMHICCAHPLPGQPDAVAVTSPAADCQREHTALVLF